MISDLHSQTQRDTSKGATNLSSFVHVALEYWNLLKQNHKEPFQQTFWDADYSFKLTNIWMYYLDMPTRFVSLKIFQTKHQP